MAGPAGSPAALSCPLVREVTSSWIFLSRIGAISVQAIIGAATAVTGDAGPGGHPAVISCDFWAHEWDIHAVFWC